MAETISNDASARRRRRLFFLIVGAAVLATIVGVAFLMNIFERKQEARNPFLSRGRADRRHGRSRPSGARTFPCNMTTTNERWIRCARATAAARPSHARRRRRIRARWSSQSKIEEDPRLKAMWAGYAFAKDFREERGHAYMLDDQTFTERAAGRQTARHLHSMPRVGLCALQESGERRPHQRL